MLVSEQKIEQADKNNNNIPATTTKLGNDRPTDDKPVSQNGQDKSESSDQGKLTNDKPAVGDFGKLAGNTEQNDNNEFVDLDMTQKSTLERTLIPMRRYPFAPLK